MRLRTVVTVAGVAALALLLSTAAAAQSGGSEAPLRTPDGQPDISGVWDFRTVTPLERPEDLADQEFLTEEEVAAYAAERVRANNADLDREEKKEITTSRGLVNGTRESRDLALAYNNFWWDRGTDVVATRRTSLVVDPPDGRIPALTPDGEARAAERLRINQRTTEGPEDRPLGERCITGFNSGPPMLPAAYNMNVQIFQTADHVVLFNEMVHNPRIIPARRERPRHHPAVDRGCRGGAGKATRSSSRPGTFCARRASGTRPATSIWRSGSSASTRAPCSTASR